MTPRQFIIPSTGLLTLALTACDSAGDPVLGTWDLVETVADGEVTSWPYSDTYTYGTYTREVYATRAFKFIEFGDAFDVISRLAYTLTYTYGTEKSVREGSRASIGKAWAVAERRYDIVIGDDGLDLSCAASDTELDCAVVGSADDAWRLVRAPEEEAE